MPYLLHLTQRTSLGGFLLNVLLLMLLLAALISRPILLSELLTLPHPISMPRVQKKPEKKPVRVTSRQPRAKRGARPSRTELADSRANTPRPCAAASQTHLEVNSVVKKTFSDYQKSYMAFLIMFATSAMVMSGPGPELRINLTLATAEMVDTLLAAAMDEYYFEGHHVSDGSKLFAAVKFFNPQLVRGCVECFPRASRALRGWRRLAPGSVRMPTPWEAMWGVVGTLLYVGLPLVAVGVLVQFNTYMRPGELCGMTPKLLIPPVELSLLTNAWGITLAFMEDGHPTKTGEYDKHILLGEDMAFLFGILHALKLLVPANFPLWPMTGEDLTKYIRLGSTAAGTDVLDLSAYGNRHGGASSTPRSVLSWKCNVEGVGESRQVW